MSGLRNTFAAALVAVLASACGVGSTSELFVDPPLESIECLSIEQRSIDFGQVAVGCGIGLRDLVVKNSCRKPVAITAELTGGDASSFGLLLPPNLQSLAPGSELMVQVRFSPQRVGKFAGAIDIRSGKETTSVSLDAEGIAAPVTQHVDVWKQPPPPMADVLFIVENSPAMAAYQSRIAANLRSYASYLAAINRDVHVAVTTTDTSSSGERGRLLPLDGTSPRVLTPARPDFAELFVQRAVLGTEGSTPPAGLEAETLALDPTKLATEGADFLRPQASLSVVLIAASDDFSSGTYGEYYDALLSVKGFRNANMFSFTAVVSYPRGKDYVRMAEDTGGVVTSIDLSDWAKDLERTGDSGFAKRARFFLSAYPMDASAIRVSIDDVPVPRNQGNIVQWRYEPSLNALELPPIALPEPDSTLKAEYDVACEAAP